MQVPLSSTVDRPAGPPRLVLVMPALNEERAIGAVLDELPAGWVDTVVVCDNGSSDGTAGAAASRGAHVVREDRRGYGRACLTALDAVFAQGGVAPAPGAPFRGSDVVIFLDADYSDYPADLPSIAGPVLRGEADLILGSRVLGGASLRALLPQAWFGNRLACGLMRLLFGARYTDLGPFRAISVDALRHLGMSDPDFGWTVEMQLKARVARLTVREVPVRYRPRLGQSKITGTVGGTVRAGAKILGWIFGWRLKLWLSSTRTGRYRPTATLNRSPRPASR